MAIRDFVITIVFSSLTFWLSAAFMLMMEESRSLGYMELLGNTVRGGELFIFSVGILGPILLMVLDETREKRFPAAIWLVALLVIGAVVCGGLFAILKTTPSVLINKELAISVSQWSALIAAGLRYIAIAYNKSLASSAPGNIQAQEHAYRNAFAARHGKG